jgi:hypothetical protein
VVRHLEKRGAKPSSWQCAVFNMDVMPSSRLVSLQAPQ